MHGLQDSDGVAASSLHAITAGYWSPASAVSPRVTAALPHRPAKTSRSESPHVSLQRSLTGTSALLLAAMNTVCPERQLWAALRAINSRIPIAWSDLKCSGSSACNAWERSAGRYRLYAKDRQASNLKFVARSPQQPQRSLAACAHAPHRGSPTSRFMSRKLLCA